MQSKNKKSEFKESLKNLLAQNAFTERWSRRLNSFRKGERHCFRKKSPQKTAAILCPPEEFQRQRTTIFPRDILVSIVVPLYNTPEDFLKEMIESVRLQSYENWELILADGSDDADGGAHGSGSDGAGGGAHGSDNDGVGSGAHSSGNAHGAVRTICENACAADSRIRYKKLEKNLGISGNTNAGLDMAAGNYIGLLDHDDFLHPSALYEAMKAVCEHDADYVYTDEAAFLDGNVFDVSHRHCKPDFAIDNLRANNYICHFSVFSAELLKKTGGFRSEYDGSQDFDLILRLTEQAQNVFHVRKILYFWRSHPASVASDISAKPYAADAARRAVEAHLKRGCIDAEVTPTDAFPAIFRIRYALCAEPGIGDAPKISILIPNKDHADDLRTCVRSILEKSTYERYELLIIENNSVSEEIFSLYRELEKEERVRVLSYETLSEQCGKETGNAGQENTSPDHSSGETSGSFNFAELMNFAAKEASGKYLLLLNNDTEVITPSWMEELLMYGQRPDVACVGAKLYYGDDTVQHAGIVIGLGADRAAGHSHYGFDREAVGYMGRLCYAQDVSAVTGACMLIKKSIYEELGGMDERFAVAYNDVDLCLKAREKGYLNVFTPFSELYHYESRSRGYEESEERKKRFAQEAALFKEKWADVIRAGDPYYSPYFSLDRADFYIEKRSFEAERE
ncbi:MAG: glycosyltransferase family 2 protein [Lachnospiraceae bacterium]|nr:glycosyltransferase family 2 protein [Lachnospiraceae bacterium]